MATTLGTRLGDHSQVVVKRTFLEFTDKAADIANLRRVCSDPVLYDADGQEREYRAADVDQYDEREANDIELIGLDEEPFEQVAMCECSEERSRQTLFLDEVELVQKTDTTDGTETTLASTGPPASVVDAFLPAMSEHCARLGQLVSDNARLAMENRLLKESMAQYMDLDAFGAGFGEGQHWGMPFDVYSNSWPATTLATGDTVTAPEGFEHEDAGLAADPEPRPAKGEGKGRKQKPSAPRQRATTAADQGTAGTLAASGFEAATTLILRNVPNNYNRAMVLDMLNTEGFSGSFDFLYLPIDFNSRASLGYVFVNISSRELVPGFWKHFDGFHRWILPSRKVCRVGWAGPHQGLAAHVNWYKNSPVMHESVPDEFKPMLFKDGERIAFPKPTRVPRIPRVRQRDDKAKAAARGRT